MPASDLHMLLGAALGVTALFAVVIVFGLRSATRRRESTLRDTRASDVLAGTGLSAVDRAALLYGVWQIGMSEVILRVRDGHDTEVASIVHRLAGTTITIGGEQCTVMATSGWHESASLMCADNGARAPVPLCTFELQGWGGGRLARYTLPDGRVFSIRSRWSLSWRRVPLPIVQNGRTVGHVFAIAGAAYNGGRAVTLPLSISLPIRLFMLYKATGSRTANSGVP
ncbi:MAG: hypothetical protein ABI440_05640 [Casimicrobiaceae bacterium]